MVKDGQTDTGNGSLTDREEVQETKGEEGEGEEEKISRIKICYVQKPNNQMNLIIKCHKLELR